MTSDVAALRPGSKTGILTSHDSSLEIAPITLDVALQEARETFNKRFTLSKSHYDEAVNFLPGGNTRSVLFTEPFPVFMKKGRGNRLWDCDGNEWVSFNLLSLLIECAMLILLPTIQVPGSRLRADSGSLRPFQSHPQGSYDVNIRQHWSQSRCYQYA